MMKSGDLVYWIYDNHVIPKRSVLIYVGTDHVHPSIACVVCSSGQVAWAYASELRELL